MLGCCGALFFGCLFFLFLVALRVGFLGVFVLEF